jgi:hypothetical protein
MVVAYTTYYSSIRGKPESQLLRIETAKKGRAISGSAFILYLNYIDFPFDEINLVIWLVICSKILFVFGQEVP